jgi:hypothetical protein
MTRTHLGLAAIACAVLVAHLLFIPYAFAPLDTREAWDQFSALPWLKLGSDQNVALASRALMFAPLGLLLDAWISPRPRGGGALAAFAGATMAGGAIALGINFAQLWFPARTASFNNVVAELAGVTMGALAWAVLGAAALAWWRRLRIGGSRSFDAALAGYVVAYLLLSLAPFDFVTSIEELSAKVRSDLYGLWLAPLTCGPAPCSLKFLAVVLAAVPCGWWLAGRFHGRPGRLMTAALVAMIVATAIEGLRFLMVSGVSQGASVIARSAGAVLGAAGEASSLRAVALGLGRYGRTLVLALMLPYAALLAFVAGWSRARILDVDAALARVADIEWLPFYYEYFAPYQSTMQSAIVHAALYAPVGLACWLWSRNRHGIALAWAAWWAAALAAISETSKLFLAGRQPDYTDVVIAVASASIMLGGLRLVSSPPATAQATAGRAPTPTAQPVIAVGLNAPAGPRAMRILAALGFVAIAGATVLGFPMGRTALALFLVAYAVLLARFSRLYLVAVPVFIPLLDFAPLSGRFYWTEFDALLATTAAVRLATMRTTIASSPPFTRSALYLLIFSVCVSAAIGAWPPAPLDHNAFSSYLSTWNALRVAKGYVWAVILGWLAWRDGQEDREVARTLVSGLGFGLVVTAAAVAWERAAFVGLGETGSSFRAGGFLSDTHVGGAYVEAILVALSPFALALACDPGRRVVVRIAWLCAALFGAVAIVLTISRAATAAWVVTMLVFGLVWAVKTRWENGAGLVARYGPVLAAVVLMGIMVAGSTSTYLRDRLAGSRQDMSVRVEHWKETLRILDLTPAHVLLGRGLGRFPREFYLTDAVPEHLPGYSLGRDPVRGPFLVLTGGKGMYMDQRVDVPPGVSLRLTGVARSSTGGQLGVSLCRKSMLNSIACSDHSVPVGIDWNPFELTLVAPTVAGGRLLLQASSLSLRNEAFGSRIEVTQLALLHDGSDILANGDFRQGLDRWFVSSDVHLAWRALNTPLQVLFEQGLLGWFAWAAMLGWALVLVRGPTSSRATTVAFAASTAGLLVVGAFDTVLDSPRIVLLLGLVWTTALLVRYRASN